MKTTQRISGIILVLLPLIIKAEAKEVPFTLDDRDRIIRTEQKVEALDVKIDAKVDGLRTEMNARFEAVIKQFEAVDQRFDQLFNFLWAIIGIFTAMMVSVFGFAFWDRKLSLASMKREEDKIKSALREYAR
ncbi:MAG: hypothetical protein D4R67_12145 [Bacteroidetes bacterium]|nr:MAG: hypothetical protein D4R67_12145 [Bacteroidota bacterium]